MRTRILTAAALLPIVGIVYFGPAWLFLLLTIAATLGMAHEVLRLFEHSGARPQALPTLAASALVLVAFFDPQRLPVEAALAAGVALIAGTRMLLPGGVHRALASMGASFAALVYPAALMGFQVKLRAVETGGWDGPRLLVFLYACVFAGDAAAYFTGRWFGRIPLAPEISPKKTVEGFLGALLGGIGLALLLRSWLALPLPPGKTAFLAGLLVVAGAFGDLSKSILKRDVSVKDTGDLLPGHGGLLDRLDGLLFAAPVLYLSVTAPALTSAG